MDNTMPISFNGASVAGLLTEGEGKGLLRDAMRVSRVSGKLSIGFRLLEPYKPDRVFYE